VCRRSLAAANAARHGDDVETEEVLIHLPARVMVPPGVATPRGPTYH
jgi:hypothetical protein